MEHKLIIEELIKQNQVMAELHEESVNTIRIMTYKGRVIAAILRMGVGKSEIDNASSGGIYAAVDIKTGIVVSHALNYKGEKYIYHPTTQTIIPGFQIPMWNECLNYVKEGAKLIKGVPLVGWDIAVTDDGPTLVEVNESPDPFLAQSILGEGIAKEINLRKKGR